MGRPGQELQTTTVLFWRWDVVGALEQGNRTIYHSLAKARVQDEVAWVRRWRAIFACTGARAFCVSLLDCPPDGTGETIPSVHEVMREVRFCDLFISWLKKKRKKKKKKERECRWHQVLMPHSIFNSVKCMVQSGQRQIKHEKFEDGEAGRNLSFVS